MAKPKAVLYARVSTADQARKDLSIPSQVEDLTVWAEKMGYEVEAQRLGTGFVDRSRPHRRMG